MRVALTIMLMSCAWPALAQEAVRPTTCTPGISCPPGFSGTGEYRPQISSAPLANKEMDALRPRLLECNQNIVSATALAYRPGYEKCAETQSQWDALMLAEKERLRVRGRQVRQGMGAPKEMQK